MEITDISQLANLLRPASKEVFCGKGKLCLSINYLNKLNTLLDEIALNGDMSSSFHTLQSTNNTVNQRDVQFLEELLQRTASLKIVPDIVNNECNIDISKFKNLRNLEVQKLNTKTLLGIQKLRCQLKRITFTRSVNSIAEILDKCAADNTNRFTWSELKQASFTQNKLVEIDDSFECTPWLHTLDLSHNELTDVSLLSCLPNLKHLNLSYNKLESVPLFRGLICTRLQSLILKHNFIEDIGALSHVINIVQVDLSQNCVLDHKSLLAVSHLVSLQMLNLQGNPLSYHPHHRNIACNYLNKNTATTRFSLDGVALSNSEKSLVGTLYPIKQKSMSSSHNSSEEGNLNSISERSRRVRNVTIEDDSFIKEEVPVAVSPSTNSFQHLTIKKHVEQLRGEYGESWLHRESGLMVQDVLGLEKKQVPYSSTPYESAIDHLDVRDDISEIKSDNLVFETANDQSLENAEVAPPPASEPADSDVSDGEDVYLGGEESIYLAKIIDGDEVLVVVTQSHISERDCTTSKERARWHVNTVLTCEYFEESKTIVKVTFNTIRRDRKQRLYELEEDEARNLVNSIKDKIASQEPPEIKLINYKCMKCSETFSKNKIETLVEQPAVNCVKCDSNMVITVE